MIKIKSVTTEDLNEYGKVTGTSKKSYFEDREPTCQTESELFDVVQDAIDAHIETGSGSKTSRFIITISTSKGKYIKTFKKGEE